MNNKKWVMLFIIGLLLLIISPYVNHVSSYRGPSTKYEYYETYDNDYKCYAGNWFGETWRSGWSGTNVTFALTNLSMHGYGSNSPNKLWYRIYKAGSDSKPIGSCLTGGTRWLINGSDNWNNINVNVTFTISKSQLYCIIFNVSGGDSAHFMYVDGKMSSAAYTGVKLTSSDYGSTWAISTVSDMCFRIYGYPANINPTQTTPIPSDISTGVLFNPKLTITINDANGYLMQCTFRTNYTGSWSTLQTNNSCINGTYSYQSHFHIWGKKVYWSVNLSCSMNLWTNTTYSFTLKVNTAPTNTLSKPTVGQLIISQPVIIITVSDINTDPMNDTIRSNYTGSWHSYIFTNGTYNATLSYTYIYYLYNHTTYWSSNLTDNHSHWTNNTYSFYLIKTQSINLSFIGIHINDTYSHTHTYTFNYGYVINDTDIGNGTGLVISNNSHNVTGTIQYQYRPHTGLHGEWWVWINHTGIRVGITGNHTIWINLLHLYGFNVWSGSINSTVANVSFIVSHNMSLLATGNATNGTWLGSSISFSFDDFTLLIVYLFALMYFIFSNKTNDLFIGSKAHLIFIYFTVILLLGIEGGSFVFSLGFSILQRTILSPFILVFIGLLWLINK